MEYRGLDIVIIYCIVFDLTEIKYKKTIFFDIL